MKLLRNDNLLNSSVQMLMLLSGPILLTRLNPVKVILNTMEPSN